MRLTKINMSKVSVPQGKSEIIQFDDSVPGFGLRVRAGGSEFFNIDKATNSAAFRSAQRRQSLHLTPASERANSTPA